MWALLKHQVFGRLFAAQVVALLGTGLLTVALGLLAFDLAGATAGAVLGIAYTIKMVAYVGLSPVAVALVANLPRRPILITADLARATVALSLPFITEVWQVYVAIFLLQAASATFTPTFQATIPDVLPDEDDYSRALSLSRLAYDIENLISPAFAGVLLLIINYHWLFGGTVIGFLFSALLILGTALPVRKPSKELPFRSRLTRGIRIYLATPRLRGLLALTLTGAAASAFVIVNTVVVVRSGFSGTDRDVACTGLFWCRLHARGTRPARPAQTAQRQAGNAVWCITTDRADARTGVPYAKLAYLSDTLGVDRHRLLNHLDTAGSPVAQVCAC